MKISGRRTRIKKFKNLPSPDELEFLEREFHEESWNILRKEIQTEFKDIKLQFGSEYGVRLRESFPIGLITTVYFKEVENQE